ncbi:MAG: hypothetical protein QOJ19_4112 [Acidimicrobiia bacterium]|nr:hypothetical protein [Acidimicrobiia bacterium]
MSATIKSTPQAIEAIGRMRGVINGGLLEQVTSLKREGDVLSDTANWDGPLARQFGETWPQTHATLVSLRDQLERLNADLDRIQQNIQAAGGA